MTEEVNKDLQLATDALESVIAYKGNSAQLFAEAVNEVKVLTVDGKRVYPPKTFPSVRNPHPGSSILTEPDARIMSGALSSAEAVAVKVLLDESSALAQSFARSFELSRLVSQVLKMEEGATLGDILEELEIKRRVVISVNDAHEADKSRRLQDGDQVKIFSSVSGG